MARSTDEKRALELNDDTAQQIFDTAVAQADPARAGGLNLLRDLRTAQAAALRRERDRLAAKRGGAHPRAARIGSKIAANDELVERTHLEAMRAAVSLPTVEEHEWAMRGRVLDGALRARSKLTVALHRDGGDRVVAIEPARTNSDGAFTMTFRGKPTDADDDGGRAADVARQRDDHDGASVTPPAYFVHVCDATGTLLHVDPRPLRPRLGDADYIEILIDDDTPRSGSKA